MEFSTRCSEPAAPYLRRCSRGRTRSRHLPSRPRRNGFNYARSDGQRMTTAIYTVDSNVIDEDMGAIAAAVVARQGRIRGNHALNSFTAVGPLAKHLIRDQAPLDVYAPLESLAAADGFVLLVGVGLEAMTLLHLAERRAGRNLFRRWARGPDGNPIMVEVGGCSRGFQRLERKLARLSREFHVGSSRWRVFPATTTLEAAERGIRATPSITRCDDPYCERCPDAIVGGPLL
jgi:aminoglycoside N3'-acetyltransferase